MFLVQAMRHSNLVVSNAEARRFIMQGAVIVDEICCGNMQEKLDAGSHVIKVGRRGEFAITVQANGKFVLTNK